MPKPLHLQSPEEIKKKVNALWERLHEYGIYTMEQLEEANAKTQLDIGIFVNPITPVKKAKAL